MREITVKVHEVTTDGLPDGEHLTGRVAFIFDGCVVTGGPLPGGLLWAGDTDVSHNQPLSGVTHWLEFPVPVWELER